jgi:ABC-type transport system involved in multi-copper enzyme maturation permease subunit
MFAVQVFDREPIRLQEAPALFFSWIQDAGGFAAFAILLWLCFGYARMRAEERARIPRWQYTAFLIAIIASAITYMPMLALTGYQWGTYLTWKSERGPLPPPPTWLPVVQSISLTAGGAFALVAVALPFVRGLAAIRWRRVWGLTLLSFKEAIRRRALYAFSFLLLVFLFLTWFVEYKPEDQVRTYVTVVSWAMTFLLLFVAALIAAFSIPTDIRQQTIHTILTKPVERFEVFLGRFLGFAGLMTLVLAAVTILSLGYVVRGIDPAAAAESLKAREPLYGELHFENTGDPNKATNVGREWDYRSYITGPQPGQPTQYAIWDFASVPSSLGNRQSVRCEFGFDIYRTTKGLENRGVPCGFVFQTSHFDRAKRDAYQQERSERLKAPGDRSVLDIDNELSEKYGYYEVPAKEVVDYHTQSVEVPAGLFRNAVQPMPALKNSKGEVQPTLEVRVHCDSRTQYVGMARPDLYLRLDDASAGGEKMLFAWNFCKGSFGLWLRLCLIIGLAVALSTYLSGVISLLVTFVLFLGGLFLPFVQSVALGTAPGGGPAEAFVRLARRQVGIIPLEESSTAAAVVGPFDTAFRWFMRRVVNLIPDVDRYDLTSYVAQGFNIPLSQMFFTGLMLVGYLLPWAVLAYYLLKWREVASNT